MRVAIVTESFLPLINGVTHSVERVLEHLTGRGHECMVVAPGAAGEHHGVPVVGMPLVRMPARGRFPVGVPTAAGFDEVRAFEPDVVHVASPFVLGAGGLAWANRLDVPAVAVYQTDVAGFAGAYGLSPARRAAWWWTRRIHERAHRTLAPSTAAMASLAEHNVERVHLWPRGVDAERFAPWRRDAALHAQWSASRSPDDGGRLVVGYVGRLAPEKHVERLAPLAHDPRVRLVVVGDGPQRERLRRLLPTAVFTGELRGAALAAAFASLDVFVHTGEHETFCQSVQEALASGLPVIAPDAGGPRDLVASGRAGLLLGVDAFEHELPAAVASFADPAVRSRFAAAARASVRRRSWPLVGDALLAHYRAVVAGDVVSAVHPPADPPSALAA
ncbi:glycosyltransferase family 1 protein [Rhodococcus rhodnii]|uniref:Glycosyl transferase n=2 Tax=Rhodococcus rhodnii TaxID=38312 RepID=R7WMI2_9NOCA|nr:glycosyltransferase family 1 protein [Rhodococcus rhodnii]EOM76503.1 glycosyl transferase [Rhodococcus rhodnii LMG 5362]TXG91937.1 glycosyltransferase family 1 protein [Rhodococcus rhodnii]